MTVFAFGKYRGRSFQEVANNEPGYCEWALRIDNPSGAMKEFVTFLTARGQTGQSKQVAAPQASDPLARLPADLVLVCELFQEDQFVVRAEKQNSSGAVAYNGSNKNSVFVPPEVWHSIGTIQGASLSLDRHSWVFPLRSYSPVSARLAQMGNIERIPSWVLQLLEKAHRQTGDELQEHRLPDKLMPYQLEGVKFGLSKGGRCLLGDDMGLGKTLQALALALQYQEDWPVLVVCPSSLRWVWKEQALDWLPDLVAGDVQVIMKGADNLDPKAKIWIISYNLLASDAKKGKFQQRPDGHPHGVVIADESHNIKDWGTARTKVVVPLLRKASRAVLLSGTPTRNSADELHAQLCGLMPEVGKMAEFRSRYCVIQQQNIFGGRLVSKVVGARNAAELNFLLTSTAMIRRLKKDVLSQLPPKRRQRVPLEVDTKHLKNIRSGMRDSESDDGLLPNLFRLTAEAKLPAVKEYLLEVLERGSEKAIIFAHHKLMLDEINDLLAQHLPKDSASHVRIDGGTPQAKRPELVKRFQEDPNCRIALLSITACGEGLTMTAAGLVIFAELYWVPGAVEQAEARAHRLGSTHSKVIVEFLVVPNSPDEQIYNSLERKKKDTSHVLNGTPESLNAARSLAARVQQKRVAEVPAEALSVGALKQAVASKRAKGATASPQGKQAKAKAKPSETADRSKVEALLQAVREGRKAMEAKANLSAAGA
eukprot:CAMPEP_0197637374 /NCGR_PEP_ID=MMETSP1338-20131121/12620_1 /TAXON_ID=43686 ORGANISM="Pelagodinium beii, Strain RCC1491" /NCGR_SAMPLE_ID=MMETSP1338 /ASSEMBLY_ACC=CAM_ASM_000754 /LENGTH=708 /DNA_ID=CAMNT_0043209793 /DNA_START=30 /DNA_END=2156 /DNA_ORIENTATION=-